MALGGAWVRTILGPNIVVFTGRTFGATTDAAILGLFGDAGVDAGFVMPQGWPNGVGQSDLVAGVIADAVRSVRTRVTVTAESATVGVGPGFLPARFNVVEGVAPWRRTVRMDGASPAAPVLVKVMVEYLHSERR